MTLFSSGIVTVFKTNNNGKYDQFGLMEALKFFLEARISKQMLTLCVSFWIFFRPWDPTNPRFGMRLMCDEWNVFSRTEAFYHVIEDDGGVYCPGRRVRAMLASEKL